MPTVLRLPYDTERFPFAPLVARELGVGDLHELSELVGDDRSEARRIRTRSGRVPR